MLTVGLFVAGVVAAIVIDLIRYDRNQVSHRKIDERIKELEHDWNAQHLYDQQQDAREKGDIYRRLKSLEKKRD